MALVRSKSIKKNEPISKDPAFAKQRMDNLNKAREARKKLKEEGVEVSIKNLYERWEGDKSSLRRSVDAKCFDCVSGELPRKRIKFCNIIDCPLWLVRPYGKGITIEECNAYIEE